MKMFFVSAALLAFAVPACTQAQETLADTYHVEVRIHYIGYVSPSIADQYEGSTYWTTQFTSPHRAEAEYVLGLFETALTTGGLEILLGLDPWNWLATDVRLRTEYAVTSRLMQVEDRPTLTQQYLRRSGSVTVRYPTR